MLQIGKNVCPNLDKEKENKVKDGTFKRSSNVMKLQIDKKNKRLKPNQQYKK